MAWHSVCQVTFGDFTVPRCHDSPVACYGLQASQRLQPQRHVKQNFDVVEDHDRSGVTSKIFENPPSAQRTLSLRKIQKGSRQLNSDIDVTEAMLLCQRVQRFVFPVPGGPTTSTSLAYCFAASETRSRMLSPTDAGICIPLITNAL